MNENMLFAQRDWENGRLYTLRNVKEQSKIRCGWLQPDGDNYVLLDCDKPYRISHKRIDEYLGGKMLEKQFSKSSGIDLSKEIEVNGKRYDPKTASYKYSLVDTDRLTTTFTEDGEYNNEHIHNRVRYDANGKITGTIVLTGQPDNWKWPRVMGGGKFYEFVFRNKIERTIPVSEATFKQFQFIYSETDEWKSCKERLTKEGIPVFFRLDNKNNLQDFGLAYLYKLPYEKSPIETLNPNHRNEKDEYKADLSECLFGYTYASKKVKEALKGRIQFSSAFSGNAEQDEDVFLTLGSPKASYYPLYVKQNGKTGIVTDYETYNDGTISGWKRYPIRSNTWGEKSANEYNDKLDTIIHPVQKGAIFIGKVRYHNLKKVELGALLSALTFHNMSECYHQIGQGKPYGFGKVKIDVKLPEALEKQKLDLMALFEYTIDQQIGQWHCDTSIEQLFTMAREEITADSVLFQYMKMDTDRKSNQFLTAKENKEYLELYSTLKKSTTNPVSLIPQFIDKFEEEKRRQSLIEEQKRIEEEQQKQEELRLKQEVAAKLQQENLQKKIEGGLAFLDEKNLKDEYKITDFKGAKSRIEQWMKKANVPQLPEDQLDALLECISRLNKKPDRKEKTLWSDFNSSIWKTISRFVGNEKAKEWFDEIVRGSNT
jgi:CRISPR-associated protein (TIGR03986 family)